MAKPQATGVRRTCFSCSISSSVLDSSVDRALFSVHVRFAPLSGESDRTPHYQSRRPQIATPPGAMQSSRWALDGLTSSAQPSGPSRRPRPRPLPRSGPAPIASPKGRFILPISPWDRPLRPSDHDALVWAGRGLESCQRLTADTRRVAVALGATPAPWGGGRLLERRGARAGSASGGGGSWSAPRSLTGGCIRRGRLLEGHWRPRTIAQAE